MLCGVQNQLLVDWLVDWLIDWLIDPCHWQDETIFHKSSKQEDYHQWRTPPRHPKAAGASPALHLASPPGTNISYIYMDMKTGSYEKLVFIILWESIVFFSLGNWRFFRKLTVRCNQLFRKTLISSSFCSKIWMVPLWVGHWGSL